MIHSKIEIKNIHLKATINPIGAELQSLKLRYNQYEIIWQADPKIWAGSAPILFPVVGRLLNNAYGFEGKTYSMPKHGIVRRRDWNLVDQGETYAEFETGVTEETLRSYPFDWKLKVMFELIDFQLKVSYQITHQNPAPLYFSLGSHPAFNLAFGSRRMEDYYIRFEGINTSQKRFKMDERGLSADSFDLEWDGNDLPLSRTLFNEDALIFKNIPCETLLLCCRKNSRYIRFETGGAPDLGIWAKPHAAYVCLEPWYGYDDPEGHNQDFTKKPGIQMLAPAEVFKTHYSINLDSHWLE